MNVRRYLVIAMTILSFMLVYFAISSYRTSQISNTNFNLNASENLASADRAIYGIYAIFSLFLAILPIFILLVLIFWGRKENGFKLFPIKLVPLVVLVVGCMFGAAASDLLLGKLMKQSVATREAMNRSINGVRCSSPCQRSFY